MTLEEWWCLPRQFCTKV